MLLPPLLAAVDLGPIITVAIMLISFIGWLSNVINGANKGKGPQPPRPQPKPRDRRVQDEIEAFLKEVTGQQQAPRPLADPEVERRVAMPSRDPEAAPVRPAPRSKKTPKPPKPKAAPGSNPQRGTPGSTFDQRRLAGKADVSQSQSLAGRMAERDVAAAARSTVQSVQPSVSHHFGTFTAENSTGRQAANETLRRAETPASELLKRLRTPGGVRQAIILSEILNRPRRFRR